MLVETTLADAAREGARYAAVAPTDTAGIVAAARGAAVVTRATSLTVTISYPLGSSASGTPVVVTVQYQLHFLTSAVTGIGTGGVLVTKSSRMIIE